MMLNSHSTTRTGCKEPTKSSQSKGVRAYNLRMGCPLCRSEYLVIRQKIGWEWIMLHFTDKRKYKCIGCGHAFRAPDRRRSPRPEGKVVAMPAETNENPG